MDRNFTPDEYIRDAHGNLDITAMWLKKLQTQAARRANEEAQSDPAVLWGDYRDPEGEAANRQETPHCTACGNRGYQFDDAGVDYPCACALDTF